MSSERGQALLIAALLIGIGALAIVGLRVVQDRVLASAQTRSAGEAAVQAAAAVIADAYIAQLDTLRAHAFDVPRPAVDLAVLTHAATLEAARAAASEAASRNGGVFEGSVDARCAGATIEVELRHEGRLHRAALPVDACSRR